MNKPSPNSINSPRFGHLIYCLLSCLLLTRCESPEKPRQLINPEGLKDLTFLVYDEMNVWNPDFIEHKGIQKISVRAYDNLDNDSLTADQAESKLQLSTAYEFAFNSQGFVQTFIHYSLDHDLELEEFIRCDNDYAQEGQVLNREIRYGGQLTDSERFNYEEDRLVSMQYLSGGEVEWQLIHRFNDPLTFSTRVGANGFGYCNVTGPEDYFTQERLEQLVQEISAGACEHIPYELITDQTLNKQNINSFDEVNSSGNLVKSYFLHSNEPEHFFSVSTYDRTPGGILRRMKRTSPDAVDDAESECFYGDDGYLNKVQSWWTSVDGDRFSNSFEIRYESESRLPTKVILYEGNGDVEELYFLEYSTDQ